MAAPTVVSTKETTNYARLCRLLVDVGSQALRDTFDGFYTPGNLHTFLASGWVHTKLKSLRTKRILNPTQWSKLYPAIPSTVSSDSFDITLLNVLLRNICGMSPPVTTGSWDKLPPATDTCREANIVRIKYFRNTVYGHAEKASVDDVTFNGLWQDIQDALVGLGGATYLAAITRLKTDCMDPDIEKHYKEVLKQWKKDEENIKDQIEELDKKFDDFVKSSVEGTEKLREEINMKLDYLTKKEINRNRPRSELPEEVFNVHGHREEVDNIVKALSADSSKTGAGVLVSGIAGVGKSTVAIQAGHRLKNESESIVKFCSLRGACKGESEDEGALREILNVCAPGQQQTSEYPRHVLRNWCRQLEYELILIVDNAEDAIDNHANYSFSNLLSDMRTSSDCKIKFLITSRRSDIGSATTGSSIQLVKIGLGPLDEKESVQVLKDGANLTSDTDSETEVKLRKIAELCENIPLALRLAGPLVAEESEYTFEELIQELEKNATETLDLQRMMKIAFEKLEEPLKHALVCLSVFARSFKRDAAEALLGKVNCAKYLIKLKQRCLIQMQDNRYILHLLIRGYARQIGESKEFHPIVAHGQQNFLEHFLSLIMRNANKYWGKNTCKESFNLFNEERLNLESTLRKVGQEKIRNCTELENVVTACQQLTHYIEYCVPFKLYDDFLKGLLQFSRRQGKLTKEVEILCLLYHESRKHGGNKQKAKELICQAIKLHDDNRPLFDQDSLSEVSYLSHFGRYLSQDCKERDESQLFLKRAISLFEKETAEHGSTLDKGSILGQIGHNARLDKRENEIRHEEALACYQEALRFRQIHYGEHLMTAFAHKNLADYYLFIENFDKANVNYKEAIRILKDVERMEQKEAVPICKNFGRCYQKSGKIEESRSMLEMGSDIADKTIEGDHKWKVWIKTYLALLLYEEYPDEESKTDKLAEEVLQMGKKLGLEEWDGKGELEEKFYKK